LIERWIKRDLNLSNKITDILLETEIFSYWARPVWQISMHQNSYREWTKWFHLCVWLHMHIYQNKLNQIQCYMNYEHNSIIALSVKHKLKRVFLYSSIWLNYCIHIIFFRLSSLSYNFFVINWLSNYVWHRKRW